jgi:hypothetical protein
MANKSKINWYARYATEHLITATDNNGMYCEVIIENIEGVIYRVDINDRFLLSLQVLQAMQAYAYRSSCSCSQRFGCHL